MKEDYLGWGIFDSTIVPGNVGELFHKRLDDIINAKDPKAGDVNPDYNPFKKSDRIQDTIDRRSVFDKLTETIRKEMEKAQVQKEIENKPLVEPDDTIKVRKITNGYIIEVDYEEVFVTNKNDIIKYLK